MQSACSVHMENVYKVQGVKVQKEVWLWLDNKQLKFLPFKCISGVLCSLNAAVIKKLFLVLSPISIANFCDFCFPWFVLLKIVTQAETPLFNCILPVHCYITPGNPCMKTTWWWESQWRFGRLSLFFSAWLWWRLSRHQSPAPGTALIQLTNTDILRKINDILGRNHDKLAHISHDIMH